MNSRRGSHEVRRRTVSRQEVVELAEACYRAHPGGAIQVAQLCRIVGMSERGLRNAFQDVRGMSPKQYMLRERLQSVRRALCDRDARDLTVTSVATDYGFFELGRFAGAYKEMFGEAPSSTLRSRTDARVREQHNERNY